MKKCFGKILILLIAAMLIMSTVISVAAAADETVKTIDVDKFSGKKIGITTGTIYDEIVAEQIKDADIKYYKSNADLLAALTSGKVDGIVQDEPVIRYLISNAEGCDYGRMATGEDYIAMLAADSARGHKIISEFNDYFAKLKESGELDKLLEKWFSGSDEDRVMDDYSKLPDTNGELIIATDPGYPPMEYVKDGMVVGYDIELIIGFCEAYGYKPVIRQADFGGILAGVKTGKFDVGASGFSITEERKKQAIFSDPVYISYGALAYRDSSATGGSLFGNLKKSFYNTFIAEHRWKSFLAGIKVTLIITVCSIIIGTLLGFIIHMLCRKGNKLANGLSRFAEWLIKGLPEVVLLMILFYIILGSTSLSGELVAIIGFSLTFACSMHAMLVSGEQSLDIGQFRAATALGYSENKAFFRLILPQAARMFMPNYLAEVSTHLKATAVVGYIAVVDITKVGDIIRGSTYDAFFPLIAVAVVYFVLAAVLCWFIKLITRRIDPTRRSKDEILKGVELR